LTLAFIPLFLPCEKALAVRDQTKMHFHIQNLTVIELTKNTNLSFLYIFPYVAPYDSLQLSLYFFPVKWPWQSEAQNLHFHIQNLTVIEPKKKTIVSFLYIFPYVAPYDSLYFSPYFFPVKWPWPSDAKKLHFHIQNLIVIEPKKVLFLHSFIYSLMSPFMTPFIYPLISSL